MSDSPSAGNEKTAGRRLPGGWTQAIVLGLVCVLVIGTYLRSANSGLLELLGSSDGSGSYYNLLVKGLVAGQLNVPTGLPAGLAQLPDPYDPVASSPYRWIAGNPVQDMSYYRGKLYLYFGVTPALLLFWPYLALTGNFLLHKEAAVIFFSIGFLVSVGLLRSIWRRSFADVPFGVVAAGALALGLANFVPAILQRSDVWEVAISCGYALTMLALFAIWQALSRPHRRGRWLMLASLFYGMAIASRPSLLFGAIILLVPILEGRRERQPLWPLLAGALGPITMIGLGVMGYNALRFHNPLEFGEHYMVPRPLGLQGANDHFSPRFLWFNFRVAFLEPARWSLAAPFVHDIKLPPLPGGADVEHPFGVLTNIPFVWLALAAPAAVAGSMMRGFVNVVALLFGACALTLGLHNSMHIRYEMEFTHALLLLATIGIFGLERALAGQTTKLWLARCGWGLLLAFAVAFNLGASMGLHGEALYNSANAALQKGNLEEAIVGYQKVVALQDSNVESAENNLATALFRVGRLDEAAGHFRHVLQINPGFPSVQYNLGLTLLAQDKLDDAASEFTGALRANPKSVNNHVQLGNVRLKQERLDDAVANFSEAIRLDSNNVEAQIKLGRILARLGRRDEAIAHLKEALRINPDDLETKQLLSTLEGQPAAN